MKQKYRYHSQLEHYVNYYNRKILDIINDKMGNDVTYNDTLNETAKKYLGNRFKGVFSSDRIPYLDKYQPYAIINLDPSNEPGSHWVGIAYDDSTKSVMVYDSFGRYSKKILPNIFKIYGDNVVDTDHDAEQRIRENNCGQRSLSWLILYDNLGKSMARLL